MSGICEIFPDDESCQVDVPVEEPVVDDDLVDEEGGDDTAAGEGDMEMEDDMEGGEAMKDEKMMDDMKGKNWLWWVKAQGEIEDTFELAGRAPLLANLFVTIALGSSTMYLWLDEFLWHDENAYKAGEINTGDTNWWKLAHYIEHYGAMAIITTVFVFQALSDASIAVPTFLLVWEYGMGTLLPLIELVSSYLLYWGYDRAYSAKNDSTSSATAVTNASTTMAGIWKDLVEHKAAHVLFELILWENKYDHYLGQWLMSTPEAQDAWIADLEEEYHHVAELFGDEHHEKGHEKGEHKEGEHEEGEEGMEGEEEAEGEEEEGEEADEEEE